MKSGDIELCQCISKKIIENVGLKIMPYIGHPESGEFVKLGADGTPTGYIDLIAENEVINVLISTDFVSFLISEEVGELKIGRGSMEHVNVSDELRKIYKKRMFSSEVSDVNDPRFIFLVDPLDGTNNAIKNIGAYCISIAICEIKNNRIVTIDDVELGFVKNFANGDYYEAIKGKGAWFNGKTMSPSKVTNLNDLSIGGFLKTNNYNIIYKLFKEVRRVRMLGSIVLELVYIADASYDAFIDMRGSRLIDIAASKLIAEESGAIVSDENDNRLMNNLGINEKTVVVGAGNKELHKKIINIIDKNKPINIRKLGIVSRLDKDEAILFGAKLIQILEKKGIDISIEHSFAYKLNKIKNYLVNEEIGDITDNILKNNKKLTNEFIVSKNIFSFEKDYEEYAKNISEFNSDILITLGGDGTLLRGQAYLNNSNNNEIPLLGVNLGNIGFLTELDIKDAFEKINSILKGEYYKEKRSQIKIICGKEIFTALNEIVIMTEKPVKMLDFEVIIDDEVVEEFRADGLILSTPSGSTAYAMSAGGPIVDPKVGAFVIIPICPYKLDNRALVVSDMSEIKVKLLKEDKKSVLVVDGQVKESIGDFEEFKFKKSENDAYFIRTTDNSFYKKVKVKSTEGRPSYKF